MDHPADEGARSRWWDPPEDVRRVLREIDPRSLEQYDRALVSSGTRHSLSSQTDPQRGIGAARDWIRGELEKAAATSDGRMTVALQSYVQEPAERIPTPTTITNVVATLRGSDLTSADRVYVVTAHYDSRVTDPLNATDDAPGANDDGSGVSAVLELARVMAPHPTEVTIVFVAVAGEEQGLFGSTRFAELAEQEGWNIQGVLNMDIIGSPLGGNGANSPRTNRLFSEGVPTSETPEETARRQAIGGENDGISRQLAPVCPGDGREPRHAHARQAGLAARPVPARRRPDPVPGARMGRRAVHRAERELRSPAPGRAGGRTAGSSATWSSSSTSPTWRG